MGQREMSRRTSGSSTRSSSRSVSPEKYPAQVTMEDVYQRQLDSLHETSRYLLKEFSTRRELLKDLAPGKCREAQKHRGMLKSYLNQKETDYPNKHKVSGMLIETGNIQWWIKTNLEQKIPPPSRHPDDE